jgi:acetyl esterase/lipase
MNPRQRLDKRRRSLPNPGIMSEQAPTYEAAPVTEIVAAPKPPRARLDDSLRVPAAALFGLLISLLRRVAGRRRRAAWGLPLEGVIAATRGAWSVMPVIGVVRWRNVGEAMSPLKTDGLAPRFVRAVHEGREVTGAWLDPADANGPVLLYLHGGGYVFGSIRTHGTLIGALARASRARTFALEYRLGPEHPAPAAHDDAVAAYRYLLAEGIAPERIVIAGDSAGGAMVLNALRALRDAGLPLPAAGVAISPWVDLSCSGASFESNAGFDFVGKVQCQLAAKGYLAGLDAKSPEVSPLYAGLEGLPPLLVHAGDAEVLIDQIRAFVARARSAGVDVECSVYPDMVHVWHMLRDVTPEGQRAIDEIGAFVQKRAARG